VIRGSGACLFALSASSTAKNRGIGISMINQASLDLIKEFEGYRSEAYPDSVGVLTIGYGTTARAGVGVVPKLGMKITKAEAEEYLRRGVEKFAESIRPAIKQPINENEFGAFVSLAYNIGPSAFKRSSALRHFNAGDKDKAAKSILLWNKAGGKVLTGLVRRREAERKLFLTPPPQKPKFNLLAIIFDALALFLASLKGK